MSLFLHLFVAQGLFFDLFPKTNNNFSQRRGVSRYSNYQNDKRSKKKSDYVCASDNYSESVKKSYNCGTEQKYSYSATPSSPNSFYTKNSQPCYDDNK